VAPVAVVVALPRLAAPPTRALRLVVPAHPAPVLKPELPLVQPVVAAPAVTCPDTSSGRTRRKANCNSWSTW
jgi:hypothetical protein